MRRRGSRLRLGFPTSGNLLTDNSNITNVTGTINAVSGNVTGSGNYTMLDNIPLNAFVRLREYYTSGSVWDFPDGSVSFQYPNGYEKVKFILNDANASGDLYVDGVLVNSNFITYANGSKTVNGFIIIQNGKILGYDYNQPLKIIRNKNVSKEILESSLIFE